MPNIRPWCNTPLYLRIIAAVTTGVAVGLLLKTAAEPELTATAGRLLLDVGKLILRLLSMVAVPLIFVAIVHALLNADVDAVTGRRVAFLLLTNTSVAIAIGLAVSNLMPSGAAQMSTSTLNSLPALDLWEELKRKVPESFVGALVPNWETGRQDIIPAILVALGLGIAIRRVRSEHAGEEHSGVETITELFEAFYKIFLTALNWIVELVPFAVFAIAVQVTASQGLAPFWSLVNFIAAVLLALALQACYYLLRVRLQSNIHPIAFLRGGREALLTAFATASSTAAAPINYRCLREQLGLREESATLGALVASNFNNDGTALYEAMAPLYVAEMIAQPIGWAQQPLVALMAIIASVGAPGIPEAGLVTMVLVFQTVGLPTEYVALLLPVDWFLDRCRTTVNLMGDMSVACILDNRSPRSANHVDLA